MKWMKSGRLERVKSAFTWTRVEGIVSENVLHGKESSIKFKKHIIIVKNVCAEGRFCLITFT